MHKHNFKINKSGSKTEYFVDTSTFDEIDDVVWEGKRIGTSYIYRLCDCGEPEELPFLYDDIYYKEFANIKSKLPC